VFDNLPPSAVPNLLRRVAIMAIVVGGIGFAVAVAFFPPMSALGELIGLGLAFLNFRIFVRHTTKVQLRGEQSSKAVRRQLGSNTLSRLTLITVVVIGALILNGPLGVGIVAGLVLYQIVFVMNVLRVVLGQGGIQ